MNKETNLIIAEAEAAAELFNENELRDAISSALSHATSLGGTSAEAGVSASQGLQASVRMGELQTLEHNSDRTLSITVYKDQHKGAASCGDLQSESIREAVEQAYAIASHTEADSCNGLAPAEQMATVFHDLDLWHPYSQTADQLIERALEIEAAGRAVDQRIFNSEGAQTGASMAMGIYGNTHGFLASVSGTSFSQSVALVAREHDDDYQMQRDYAWDHARRFSDLDAAGETGRLAGEKTVGRLGARSIPTGESPVVFTADVARGLLGHMVSALSGSSIYRQASFLLDKIGTPLFPEFVQVSENPHELVGVNSASYDSDGVATGLKNALIVDGVIQRYILSSYSARRLSLQTTGNAGGVRNLAIKAGEKSLQGLIKTMHKGLVVTELMGQGINIVNGNYSRGASGFWVENGEIAYPVQEVTIAGNLKDMFGGLVELGNDIDSRRNIQTPSWLIEQMVIAGN